MTLRNVLLVGALLLSGCASAPEPVPEVAAPGLPVAEPLQVEVLRFSHHTLAALWENEPPLGESQFAFTTTDATGILVELSWNHTVWAMDLFLRSEAWSNCERVGGPTGSLVDRVFCVGDDAVGFSEPGEFAADGGTAGSPSSPIAITLEGATLRDLETQCEGPCDWLAWTEKPEPRADVEWHLFVSVFHGQEVPNGYTAIPW